METEAAGSVPKIALFSSGLWRLRRDVEALTGSKAIHHWLPARPDCALGWGRKESHVRAARFAARHNLDLMTLEDGFLSGYAPKLAEPRHSYVLDRTGIYFDTLKPNDLETLIAARNVTPQDEDRARSDMDRLVAERVTKFNCWPHPASEAAQVPCRPFLLVVDQVSRDASIAGAGADQARFVQMLQQAAGAAGGRLLVIRTHPANVTQSILVNSARKLGIAHMVVSTGNPWNLVLEADAVWTISSQLGFEALMAGKQVHAFGRSFYAGRGLTVDHFPQTGQTPINLPGLFHILYRQYSRWLDLHTRKPTTFDVALEQALTVRNQRDRIPAQIVTGGLSPWKRKAVAPFLIGQTGKPRQCLTLLGAFRLARARGGTVAVWGAQPTPSGSNTVRIEDGFIRSSGLGAALVYPSSLVMDARGAHFDCSKPSDLEMLLQTESFSEPDVTRAANLREMLVKTGVTKYNTGQKVELPKPPVGTLKILVPGQVEADASIRTGSPEVKTNFDLVKAVRDLFPDAFIVYKIHPDTVAGLRSAGRMPEHHDHLAREGTASQWMEWADRIETMTSLTGFEALLRGKAVGVHGMPAYAGWGLTDDRMDTGRRTRKLKPDELVCGILVRYPMYVHPVSRLPCKPEELVELLAAGDIPAPVNRLSIMINRLAIRLRDQRLN